MMVYGGNAAMMSQMQLQAGAHGSHRGEGAVRCALARFGEAWLAAQAGRIWARLSGRSQSLLRLGDVAGGRRLGGGHYGGLRSVPIDRIRGSEGRCRDFDAGWRPLQLQDKDRWVRLATAWQQGVVLPPVELIQVGDLYFVRDGHHRISVAQAWGQASVDAEVTVWA